MSEEKVSDLLFSLHEPIHGKPQLLVMGTIEENQLPKPNSMQHNGGLWSQLMGFSQRVIVSALNFSVSIVLNILKGVYDFAIPLLKRNEEPSDASRRWD
jgi:hypothetical protein